MASVLISTCVCVRFIYSQDQSTYFLQQNRQADHGNEKIAHRHMNVEISGNICFEFSVFVLCCVLGTSDFGTAISGRVFLVHLIIEC